jgi:multidrug efflux pump subunit AcrA (membrane-fusion protein)
MREVTIKRISPGVDPRTRTIEIVATLDNADGKLKPGMLAEVHVPTGASFSHGVQSAARDGSQGRREN